MMIGVRGTDSWKDATDYMIGATITTMASLRDMGIPPPDQAIFQPAATYYVRGDHTRVGDGTAVATWIWDVICLERLSAILDHLDGEDYANVYIQTAIRDGRYSRPSLEFDRYSAIMWWPLLFGQEGVPIARSPFVMQTVKIQFVNVVLYSGYL